jgi:hypothetical protein
LRCPGNANRWVDFWLAERPIKYSVPWKFRGSLYFQVPMRSYGRDDVCSGSKKLQNPVRSRTFHFYPSARSRRENSQPKCRPPTRYPTLMMWLCYVRDSSCKLEHGSFACCIFERCPNLLLIYPPPPLVYSISEIVAKAGYPRSGLRRRPQNTQQHHHSQQ